MSFPSVTLIPIRKCSIGPSMNICLHSCENLKAFLDFNSDYRIQAQFNYNFKIKYLFFKVKQSNTKNISLILYKLN